MSAVRLSFSSTLDKPSDSDGVISRTKRIFKRVSKSIVGVVGHIVRAVKGKFVARGFEDSESWNRQAEEMRSRANHPSMEKICARCRKKYEVSHCENAGCRYCASCGEHARPSKT